MQPEWNNKVKEILKNYRPNRMYLIKALHHLQNEHPQAYLPSDTLEQVANYFNLTKAEVYGIVTYYSMFSIKPRNKYIVRLCKSPVCYLKGSLNLLQYLEGKSQITVEFSECLGQCDQAPVMMINDKLYTQLTAEKIEHILSNLT